MKEVVLIPQERINVLKDKKTKDKIEKELNVKLTIEENIIEIDGGGLTLFQAKNIVKAIGRGFSPEKAFRLLNEDEEIEIIELKGFTDKKLRVIKSRLIGTKGKARKEIEKCSGCSVSIYGKTVSLIGNYKQIGVAREAINMIIRGSKHSKVYGFLQMAKSG